MPYDSPIRQSGLLFYNTLFDENAACHLALGMGFADSINDFEHKTLAECRALGVNDSMIHEDFMIGSEDMDIDAVCAQAKLPCVVKPDDSGSSIGVSIANDEAELRAALEAAAREGSRILIEQYIRGREVQIGILGDKALPSIEIIPAEGFYDYRNKYQPGAAKEITPAEIPAETEQRLADAALTVFHALNLSAYSRADFILDAEGELWFLEINTLPGMTPTSLVPQEAAAVGISYSELCEQIIAAALHK